MSFKKRRFIKHTIIFPEDIERAFDSKNKIVRLKCSNCNNPINIEFELIRSLSGRVLFESRKKKKKK